MCFETLVNPTHFVFSDNLQAQVESFVKRNSKVRIWTLMTEGLGSKRSKFEHGVIIIKDGMISYSTTKKSETVGIKKACEVLKAWQAALSPKLEILILE